MSDRQVGIINTGRQADSRASKISCSILEITKFSRPNKTRVSSVCIRAHLPFTLAELAESETDLLCEFKFCTAVTTSTPIEQNAIAINCPEQGVSERLLLCSDRTNVRCVRTHPASDTTWRFRLGVNLLLEPHILGITCAAR